MWGKTSSCEVSVVRRLKRPRRERTHDWQRIQQYTLWPGQNLYEVLRPVVLFNESAAERAQETGTAERTLQRKAEQFESRGMASLFPKEPTTPSDDARSLPPDMRQVIVDLQAEHPPTRNRDNLLCALWQAPLAPHRPARARFRPLAIDHRAALSSLWGDR